MDEWKLTEYTLSRVRRLSHVWVVRVVRVAVRVVWVIVWVVVGVVRIGVRVVRIVVRVVRIVVRVVRIVVRVAVRIGSTTTHERWRGSNLAAVSVRSGLQRRSCPVRRPGIGRMGRSICFTVGSFKESG